MKTSNHSSLLLGLLLAALLVPGLADAEMDNWRLRGSLGGWAYGYQNADNIHHVWFLEQTNLSLYRTGTPWSAHFSGGWVGDYENDEGLVEDELRFTRGYLRYGGLGSPVRAQLGRFFLVRGPAIGVLDGLDVQYNFRNGIRLAAFGGLWGPLSRRFEFEEPDDSRAFGAEIGWTARDFLYARRTHVALGYANIEREGEALRHRVDLRTYHQFHQRLVWYNLARFRVEGAPLQRLVSRLRFNGEMGTRMAEIGVLSPEMPTTSWFSDVDDLDYTLIRIRAAADHWIVKDRWGLGADVAMLLEEQAGYRIGPYAKFPWGRLGYHFYLGDQPTANGFWAQVMVTPIDMLDVYAYGSMATYEWAAFDVEENDVMSFYGGVNLRAPFAHALTLNLEYQQFQTPQYDQDRRAMAGLRWAFDTAEGNR